MKLPDWVPPAILFLAAAASGLALWQLVLTFLPSKIERIVPEFVREKFSACSQVWNIFHFEAEKSSVQCEVDV